MCLPLAHKPRGHDGVAAEQAEAVPDRLPCKGADVPEGELGVENLTTVVEPCEFLEIN